MDTKSSITRRPALLCTAAAVLCTAAAVLSTAAALCVPVLGGCGARTSSLDKEIGELEARLKKKDCEGLYGRLSKERQEAMPREAFVKLCQERQPELEALLAAVAALKKSKKKPSVDYRALVTLKDGSTLVMVYEKDGWKIDTDLVTFYPQSTPQEAVASFIKAFEAKRWDVLAQFMPSKYTAEDDAKILEKHWSEPAARAEMEQLLLVLKDHLGEEMKVEGNRATMEFAPQHRVELLKERGVWVIVKIY
jgi:hypothetical protein